MQQVMSKAHSISISIQILLYDFVSYLLFFRLVTMAMASDVCRQMTRLSWQTTMKSSRPLRLRSCQWSPTCTSTCWTLSTSRARSTRTIRGCILAGVVFTGLIAALGKVTDKVRRVVRSMSKLDSPTPLSCAVAEKSVQLKSLLWAQKLFTKTAFNTTHHHHPQKLLDHFYTT